jgi:SOS-response transcriptional repressor LexA
VADRPALSGRQALILDTIRASVRDHGYPPSLRELAKATEINSTSTVADDLRRLAARGWIRVAPGIPRGIVLVDDLEPVSLETALRRIGLTYLDTAHKAARYGPPCGQDMAVIGLPSILYTYETCSCGTPEYDHLIEQLWHRGCFVDSGNHI